MTEAVIHLHRGGPLLALLGNPNCGKTALFNQLTGSRQKVANYAGVTVERKEGRLITAAGRALRLLDLPGAYSLHPSSPDEQVTRDVLYGRALGEKRPDLVLCVVDASNLRRHLRLVLAARRLGLPCVVVLNMVDVAEARGLRIDEGALSAALGMPVIPTVAVKGLGIAELKALLDAPCTWETHGPMPQAEPADHDTIDRLLGQLGLADAAPPVASDRIDRVVLHPVIGPLLLAAILFLVFQAVFAGAEAPKGWIEAGTAWVGNQVSTWLPEGWVRSLLVDGIVAGLGGVLAFLLDRLMGSVGLSGRSFIPLLSSFACAIPGILAARTISNPRDRLVTIMIAPLMTCSARLPVYALLIGAFVPARHVGGVFELQGLVLFGLYIAGIVGAMAVAWLLKHLTTGGQVRTLMMELPTYHWPQARNIALGLWQRVKIFLRRVGGIILVLTVALWLLASFPSPPPGATAPAIEYSVAGMIGKALAVVFEPIGFNWQISIALIPGLAAREVVVSSLGTVYALSAAGPKEAAQHLAPVIAQHWSLATAAALLAWFVFAPQCLATLATVRREVNRRWIPWAMAGYLFALAYAAAFVTYRLALALGLG